MQILAATNNRHKLEELTDLLAPVGVEVIAPVTVGGIPAVAETEKTFAENAILKATIVARAAGHVCFADDSGLEVAALGGRPGVHSARYGGAGATDAARMEKLLRELAGENDRRARFVCVLAVATPDGLIGTAAGEVVGRIAQRPAGDGGFGYDPLFVPDGHQRTFGQLGPTVKEGMSHRAAAIAAAARAGLFRRAAAAATPHTRH